MDASNQLSAFVKETVSLIESFLLFSAYERSGFFEISVQFMHAFRHCRWKNVTCASVISSLYFFVQKSNIFKWALIEVNFQCKCKSYCFRTKKEKKNIYVFFNNIYIFFRSLYIKNWNILFYTNFSFIQIFFLIPFKKLWSLNVSKIFNIYFTKNNLYF